MVGRPRPVLNIRKANRCIITSRLPAFSPRPPCQAIGPWTSSPTVSTHAYLHTYPAIDQWQVCRTFRLTLPGFAGAQHFAGPLGPFQEDGRALIGCPPPLPSCGSRHLHTTAGIKTPSLPPLFSLLLPSYTHHPPPPELPSPVPSKRRSPPNQPPPFPMHRYPPIPDPPFPVNTRQPSREFIIPRPHWASARSSS